ncbi:MAG: hypothetical protein F6K19_12810 [Cyanothece sp. SIO1E1]|nr:hypothetical protein [Cyanothece sp. SIO1E1]
MKRRQLFGLLVGAIASPSAQSTQPSQTNSSTQAIKESITALDKLMLDNARADFKSSVERQANAWRFFQDKRIEVGPELFSNLAQLLPDIDGLMSGLKGSEAGVKVRQVVYQVEANIETLDKAKIALTALKDYRSYAESYDASLREFDTEKSEIISEAQFDEIPVGFLSEPAPLKTITSFCDLSDVQLIELIFNGGYEAERIKDNITKLRVQGHQLSRRCSDLRFWHIHQKLNSPYAAQHDAKQYMEYIQDQAEALLQKYKDA